MIEETGGCFTRTRRRGDVESGVGCEAFVTSMNREVMNRSGRWTRKRRGSSRRLPGPPPEKYTTRVLSRFSRDSLASRHLGRYIGRPSELQFRKAARVAEETKKL